MSAIVLSQALHQHVFAIPEATVYAILDGASVPDLPQMLAQMGVEAECLFRGELESDMVQVAPYLVALSPDHPFTEWLLKAGWGKHWGIFAVSQASLRTVRMHLRTFLKVYSPDLKPLYFRFYDPRVLRAYLPTCNAEELRIVFGPVIRYVLEGENIMTLLKYWSEGGQLKSELAQLA